MSSQAITLEPSRRTALKKLKLGKLIDTLPDRPALAQKSKAGTVERDVGIVEEDLQGPATAS